MSKINLFLAEWKAETWNAFTLLSIMMILKLFWAKK